MSWLKLHREIRDHEVFKDPDLLQLFMWCLINANVTTSEWKGETIVPGQFVTGRNRASEAIGVSPSTWQRRIAKLSEIGCISTKAGHNWTIITVVNWNTYNGVDEKNEEKRTASEHPNGQQVNTQTDTIKELKNLRIKENTGVPVSEKPFNPNETIKDFAATETVSNLPPAETPPEKFSEFDVFQTGYSTEFKQFRDAYPIGHRVHQREAWRQWQLAVARLMDAGLSEIQATGLLIAKTEAYAKSERGRSEYCVSMDNFLKNGVYESPPEAWQFPKKASNGCSIAPLKESDRFDSAEWN